MFIVVIGLVTFAVVFLLLRNTGGVLRHVLAVLFCLTVAPISAYLAFNLFHRHGGKPSYTSPEVWEAQQLAAVLNGGAILLGLIAGLIVATIMRRKGRAGTA